MTKVYIGIDPGKAGGIMILNRKSGTSVEGNVMPLIGKEYDVRKIFEILSGAATEDSKACFCAIEDVHAIYGSSAGSTFEFGYGVGLLEGIVVALGIPYAKIQPKKWQKEMFEGIPNQQKKSSTGKTMVNDTKKMAEMAASRLFPDIDLKASSRCKKVHDGMVDALLIAEYAKRKF